jgi:hypothetical protein
MWSLNCDYFINEFPAQQLLIDFVIDSGWDPNYEITLDGKGTGEFVIDLLTF